MSHRKEKIAAEIGAFMRQYQRKAHAGHDPNDRSYSRKLEAKLKRMRPEDLDELLHGEDSQQTTTPSAADKQEGET
jgi:hypothetical protein